VLVEGAGSMRKRCWGGEPWGSQAPLVGHVLALCSSNQSPRMHCLKQCSTSHPATDNLELTCCFSVSRYGISQTLDRVFTAPNLVKKVMCDESRIQDAYIGDRSTQVGGLRVLVWAGRHGAGCRLLLVTYCWPASCRTSHASALLYCCCRWSSCSGTTPRCRLC
jgi:hypothetical protein